MTGDITRGMTDVRALFKAFFQAKMPAIITQARIDWNLEDWQLPDIQTYDENDPYNADSYPVIYVTSQTDSLHTTMAVDEDAAVETWPQYSIIIGVGILTPRDPVSQKTSNEYPETIRLRDDMTALVQNVIKNNPGLLAPDVIEVDVTTINTTYQQPFKPNNSPKVYVAGAIMSMSVRKREITWNPPIGSANDVLVDYGMLTP